MSVKKNVVFREPEALAIDDVGCFVGGSTTKFGILRYSLTKIDCSTRSQDATARHYDHDTETSAYLYDRAEHARSLVPHKQYMREITKRQVHTSNSFATFAPI